MSLRQRRSVDIRSLGVFALGLLGVVPTLTGQPAPEPRDDDKRVVLHLSGGMKESGWLAALSDSSITLDTGNGLVTLRRAQLEGVDVLTNPQMEMGVLGLFTSSFLVTLLTSTEFPHDTHLSTDFTEESFGVFAVALIGSLPGGVVGAIADSHTHPDRRSFRLGDDPHIQQAEWTRLERHIATAGWRRWNINVQSASVFPGAAPVLRQRQQAAGYTTSTLDPDLNSTLDSELNDEIDDRFLWLRRIDASYGLRPDLDVGVMMIYGSEAYAAGEIVVEMPLHEPDGYRHVAERVTGVGYFAAAHYRPLSRFTSVVDLSLGAGVGLSRSTFTRDMESNPGGRDVPNTTASQEVTTISPTAAVSVDLKLAVTQGVQIGVGTDLMIAPSMEVPAHDEFGIAGGTIPLRTLSVGFTFGYRF